MNCAEWQERIAMDAEDGAAAEHASVCAVCTEFTRDLEENAAALRSMEPDAAAYAVVRARVMEAVSPRRRVGWLWAAAGAVTAVAIAVIFLSPPRIAMPPAPKAVVFAIPAPNVPVPARRVVRRVPHRTRRTPVVARAARVAPVTAIKLLTDDPSVVIIWLVDNKESGL